MVHGINEQYSAQKPSGAARIVLGPDAEWGLMC